MELTPSELQLLKDINEGPDSVSIKDRMAEVMTLFFRGLIKLSASVTDDGDTIINQQSHSAQEDQ